MILLRSCLLGEKEKTVSNWKSRDKWDSNVVLQINAALKKETEAL
ncbi:hypothetical protein COI69_12120 [Bacillus cereus]|uniref:Terminase ATPase subunit N-terminal domain-containing protein n=1 Tax=Bacillus cereus TaxID=1396 RepID=A0A9X7E7M2_BACCE|nr:hypothetical protein [Bacillus cereus]PHA10680.1 hypothetical protein COE70_30725 [Bacillus cereus]PHG82455.1 hypothetical protein COI69_12120 [Bacillus cereus]HDR4539089.1 hypothetical protein [Bacillus cereus]